MTGPSLRPARWLLLFAAASVIWGSSSLFIRIAVEHMPPSVVVFGRTNDYPAHAAEGPAPNRQRHEKRRAPHGRSSR